MTFGDLLRGLKSVYTCDPIPDADLQVALDCLEEQMGDDFHPVLRQLGKPLLQRVRDMKENRQTVYCNYLPMYGSEYDFLVVLTWSRFGGKQIKSMHLYFENSTPKMWDHVNLSWVTADLKQLVNDIHKDW